MVKVTMPLEQLAAAERWTYRASRQSGAEPAAWAALALTGHNFIDAGRRPAAWLAEIQQDDGAVGISAADTTPCWPTSLALWSWAALDAARGSDEFRAPIEAAAAWSLANHGKTAPRSTHIGHDTEITGWSWAADTHSWLEPTCMFVLGLRAAGYNDHARVREGVRLIVDRLLPAGGANYGNTIVLGQPLVPHVQPTGLAMLALGGEDVDDPRVGKSLDYLRDAISPELAAPSLAFACLGLAAHGRWDEQIGDVVQTALGRDGSRELSTYEQALLLISIAPAVAVPPSKLANRQAPL